MNRFDFDLKILNDFNTLEKNKKVHILSIFNLNRYKFIIDELKKIHEVSDNKEFIEKRISEIFKEGCLNFNIINSIYQCNMYIGGKYHLYFNKDNKKYYLYLLKKEKLEDEDYLGFYILNNDLIWNKIHNEN